MSRNLTIAVANMLGLWRKRDRAEELIRDAASKGAQVRPTGNFEGPYFCKDKILIISIGHNLPKTILCWNGFQLFWWNRPTCRFFESAENVFNSVALLDLMEVVGEYIESPIFPMDRNSRKNFISSRHGFKIWETRYGKQARHRGTSGSWQQERWPKGAEILLYPTTIVRTPNSRNGYQTTLAKGNAGPCNGKPDPCYDI